MPNGGKTTKGTVKGMVDGERFSTSTGSREMRWSPAIVESNGITKGLLM